MKWSTKFYEYALEENYFARSGLIGKDDGACIQVKTDLQGANNVGDTVRFEMTSPLAGVGGGDNFNMSDLLEAYTTFYFDVVIHERGHATGLEGPMDEQRMIEDWPVTAMNKCAAW